MRRCAFIVRRRCSSDPPAQCSSTKYMAGVVADDDGDDDDDDDNDSVGARGAIVGVGVGIVMDVWVVDVGGVLLLGTVGLVEISVKDARPMACPRFSLASVVPNGTTRDDDDDNDDDDDDDDDEVDDKGDEEDDEVEGECSELATPCGANVMARKVPPYVSSRCAAVLNSPSGTIISSAPALAPSRLAPRE